MVVLLFFGGFIDIGGEWFQMWRSTAWNGLDTAFRNVLLAIATLVMIHLPVAEAPDAAQRDLAMRKRLCWATFASRVDARSWPVRIVELPSRPRSTSSPLTLLRRWTAPCRRRTSSVIETPPGRPAARRASRRPPSLIDQQLFSDPSISFVIRAHRRETVFIIDTSATRQI